MKNIIFTLDENADEILNKTRQTNLIIGDVKKQIFSDNEISLSFKESVRGDRVFLLISPSTSDDIMTLMLAIDSVKRSGAKEIIPILTYYPYSRGDKRDNLRGPIGGKVIANMIENLGATSLVTFELHAGQIEGFFNIPIIHLEGKDIFYNIFKDADDDIILCAPDAGASKRVEHLIDNIKNKYNKNISYVIINKTRKSANIVDKMVLLGDVKNKNVYIYDDMIDTFGTADKAVETLLENGAKSVRMFASHGILSGPAYERINISKIDELIITDSIKTKFNNKIRILTIGEQIANAIDAINSESSYEGLKQERF